MGLQELISKYPDLFGLYVILSLVAQVALLGVMARIAWVLIPFLSTWKENFSVQIATCDGKFNLIEEKIRDHDEDLGKLEKRVVVVEARVQKGNSHAQT